LLTRIKKKYKIAKKDHIYNPFMKNKFKLKAKIKINYKTVITYASIVKIIKEALRAYLVVTIAFALFVLH